MLLVCVIIEGVDELAVANISQEKELKPSWTS